MRFSYLLIDENELDRFIVRKVIEQTDKYHYAIKTLGNAEEALFLIEREPYELSNTTIVLVDLHMPLMNGFQFVQEFEKFRLDIREKYIIYALTSSLDRNEISRIMAFDSVRDIIDKPLTKNKLIDVLQQIDSMAK